MEPIVSVIILVICIVMYGIEEKRKKEKKEKKWAKEGYELPLHVQLYEQCRKEGITDVTSSLNQRRVIAVAQNMNQFKGWNFTPEVAANFYSKGEKNYEKELAKKEYYKNLKIYNKQKEDADLVGTDKYLVHAKHDLMVYGFSRPQARETHSVKGAALKGSILGGTAYGIACAMEAQRKNEANEEWNKHRYDRTNDPAFKWSLHYPLLSRDELEDRIELVKSLLWDDSDISALFSALKFSNISCTVTKDNTIEVKGNWEINKKFVLLEKPAFLDGSLRIEILDQNNKFIGYSYCVAPGVGDLMMSEAGFAHETSFEALYVPSGKERLDPNQKFYCRIEPHHLWLMTKQ